MWQTKSFNLPNTPYVRWWMEERGGGKTNFMSVCMHLPATGPVVFSTRGFKVVKCILIMMYQGLRKEHVKEIENLALAKMGCQHNYTKTWELTHEMGHNWNGLQDLVTSKSKRRQKQTWRRDELWYSPYPSEERNHCAFLEKKEPKAYTDSTMIKFCRCLHALWIRK